MDSRKLRYSLMMLVALVAFGTIGYYYFERMPFFDAFYMTIITISTVGFSEIVPLTKVGRSITVVIIILGISVGTYTVSIIVQWLVSGELQKIFGRRKLQKQIADLKNHFIICGFGRIGHIICQELFEDSINFVVIEQDHAAIEDIISLKYLFIEMDATSEDALLAAGIMNARGLVAAVNSDANNVFITLTAKGLRPDIFVMARSSEEKNEEKLIKAGATRVVSPYLIAIRRPQNGARAQAADGGGLFGHRHCGQQARTDHGRSRGGAIVGLYRKEPYREPVETGIRRNYRGDQERVRPDGVQPGAD